MTLHFLEHSADNKILNDEEVEIKTKKTFVLYARSVYSSNTWFICSSSVYLVCFICHGCLVCLVRYRINIIALSKCVVGCLFQ